MKFFPLICLLTSVSNGKDLKTNEKTTSVAFESVTRYLSQLETRTFIVNYGVDFDTMTWLLLKKINEIAMPIQLKNRKLENGDTKMDSSALLIFDSIEKVRSFNHKLNLTNEFYKPLQLFVFCQGATITDIETLAHDVFKRKMKRKTVQVFQTIKGVWQQAPAPLNTELTDSIQYEYFLVVESQGEYQTKVMSFVWYSPGQCSKLNLIEINRFSKITLKWKSNIFSVEKLANFHGCRIKHTEQYYYWGSSFSHYIPESLESHLNYERKEWTQDEGGRVDVIYNKGCYNSFDVHEHDEDPISQELEEKFDFFITKPVEFDPVNMAVPPSENYSEYDKLLMPFDGFTWGLILFTFAAAFATILMLNYAPRRLRDFIIGSNVTSPSLNVVQVFFGIGMITLPRRNFARYLTLSLILYSLIIRTAWQGKMFEFMQKDIAKPELKTIEEMIEKGYTFYMEDHYKEKFPESEISQRGKIFEANSSATDAAFRQIPLMWQILDPKFKGVLQVNPSLTENFIIMTKLPFLARIREEVLYVRVCGMKFLRHHHFTGIFDSKIQQLFDGGIIPRQNNDYEHITFNRDYKLAPYKRLTNDGPKVLTLTLLEPGFVIWIVSLLLAVLALLLEWLTALIKYLVVKYL